MKCLNEAKKKVKMEKRPTYGDLSWVWVVSGPGYGGMALSGMTLKGFYDNYAEALRARREWVVSLALEAEGFSEVEIYNKAIKDCGYTTMIKMYIYAKSKLNQSREK